MPDTELLNMTGEVFRETHPVRNTQAVELIFHISGNANNLSPLLSLRPLSLPKILIQRRFQAPSAKSAT
jgi:hypothetical protein